MSRHYEQDKFIPNPSWRRGDPTSVSGDHSPEPYLEPESPLLHRDMNTLRASLPQPPPARFRPSSLPPQYHAAASPRLRSRSRSHFRSPPGKARRAIDSTFTQSSSGIGVCLLGAVVGGLAAREVSNGPFAHRTARGWRTVRTARDLLAIPRKLA